MLRACSSSAALTAIGLHTQVRTHRTSSGPAYLHTYVYLYMRRRRRMLLFPGSWPKKNLRVNGFTKTVTPLLRPRMTPPGFLDPRECLPWPAKSASLLEGVYDQCGRSSCYRASRTPFHTRVALQRTSRKKKCCAQARRHRRPCAPRRQGGSGRASFSCHVPFSEAWEKDRERKPWAHGAPRRHGPSKEA